DKGGSGVGYFNGYPPVSDFYRVSRVPITNCTDKGGGYCVYGVSEGSWLNYTIDVRVGGLYTVETRVAGVGTNGQFGFLFFTNNGTAYTNTEALTIPTTNWTN